MAARAHDDQCSSCHAPLTRLVPPDSPIRGEGVTCDGCHTMREARAERTGAGFSLNLGDNVKYGPFCDAKNHYFHKVGCSPLFSQALQCGACHLLYEDRPGGTRVPVFTEYEEWAESTFGSTGVVCQDCHMPGSAAELAIGSGKRPLVSHHGFMGTDDLRRDAITWQVDVSGDAKNLHVEVSLKNQRAGHAIPTGFPGRRLALRARVHDQDGKVTSVAEKIFARILVDEAGTEVPFYVAVRVASDNRLLPGASRTETFELKAPRSGELEVELATLGVAPVLALELDVPLSEEATFLTTRVPFGTPLPGGGGRTLLPKTVSTR